MAITEIQTIKKPAGTFYFKEAAEKGLVKRAEGQGLDSWVSSLPGFIEMKRIDLDENTREFHLTFNTFPDYVNYLDELVKHPQDPVRNQWNISNNIVLTSELKNT